MTIEQALQAGLQHQHAGQFAQAEQLYRQALAMDPNHPDAWHLLGTLAQACNRTDLALEYVGKAIALRPAPEYYLNYGNMLLGAKKLDEAVAALRRAVALRPGFAEAYYVLGLALKGLSRVDEACDALARAVAIKPDWADARNGLGVLLKAKGDLDGAAESYREAIRLKPDFVGAIGNLALTLKLQGKLDEAIAAHRRAIELDPRSVDNLINLGMALFEHREVEAAIENYRRAIQISPDNAMAHNNLGIALTDLGMLVEAVLEFREAIKLNPISADPYSNLGNALNQMGQTDESILAHQRAIGLDPNDSKFHSNIGIAFRDKGDLAQAMKSFQRAIELDPDDADSYNNLGLGLKEQGRIDEAIAAYRKAISLKPKCAEAYNNLGALKEQGRLDEAVAAIRRAVELDPKASEVHSNLIFEINFHPEYDQGKILAEARDWSRQRADPLMPEDKTPANDGTPDRKLKIGYVSADLTYHPVGRFIAPLIEGHDRNRFEIHCFSNVSRADEATNWFRQKADRWHDIRPLSDAATAELIAKEQIDILVDLSLHTGGNRLLVFARKPAPIQVTHLAYCGTSGMQAMDYVMADSYLLPPELEPFFTEQPVRLPNCYWCYRTLPDSPEAGPLPASSSGQITFGCLNNFGKVSQAAFETWCRLLREVPKSRLLLHSKEGSHRKQVRDRLSKEGVDPDRLDFVGFVPLSQYLRQYLPIDIALDPFPFAGGTTTCDALWMGVPVVSLAGRTTVSRGGLSILTNAGLPELVARSPDEYVTIAVELANDLPRLVELRATMRQRMKTSPLMDEPRYVADVESAYRVMWSKWCEQKKLIEP